MLFTGQGDFLNGTLSFVGGFGEHQIKSIESNLKHLGTIALSVLPFFGIRKVRVEFIK